MLDDSFAGYSADHTQALRCNQSFFWLKIAFIADNIKFDTLLALTFERCFGTIPRLRQSELNPLMASPPVMKGEC